MKKHDTWCRHRTPFSSEYKTCKAGVDFHQFNGSGIHSMPCLGESPEAIARCPQYSAWTPEEIAAREAEFEAILNRSGVIRRAIIENVKATGIHYGDIPCPACKNGLVRYSQASNGHVHAQCSTTGCASWME